MLEARTLSIAVDLPWMTAYEALWRPETFPRWASGLSKTVLTPDGDSWLAEGPEGRVRIRFTPHNAFGVMDHWVDLPDGAVVAMPMRVIANGAAAEVLVTVFRQPGMTAETYKRDLDWVARDLASLKAWVEAGQATS